MFAFDSIFGNSGNFDWQLGIVSGHDFERGAPKSNITHIWSHLNQEVSVRIFLRLFYQILLSREVGNNYGRGPTKECSISLIPLCQVKEICD